VTESWTAVREAFSEVLQLEPDHRAAYLDRLPPHIVGEVRSLLVAHESAVRFIEPVLSLGSLLGPDTRLGPYLLKEKVGEGGMGVVFRAERVDGEFRREVALKVIGGRLFAPEAERRFLAERQILARLEHPNVVRMLDGGLADGHRWLVMEFVTGEPITDFCTARNLSLAERLSLFRDVCAAMQYTHQNLVIHRDIKSRNVLVTDAGEVKVLDFGIAQLLSGDAAGSPAATTALHP
jgi:serine/threonine protein kinase